MQTLFKNVIFVLVKTLFEMFPKQNLLHYLSERDKKKGPKYWNIVSGALDTKVTLCNMNLKESQYPLSLISSCPLSSLRTSNVACWLLKDGLCQVAYINYHVTRLHVTCRY